MAHKKDKLKDNPVEHPKHYTSHPSGIEAIEICQWMSFCLGNVMKYIWRADFKNNALEDLRKGRWYLDKEIHRREQQLKNKETLIIHKKTINKQKKETT
jgi:hypothetical protein